jgi:aminoglycoside 6'-N-acetyltransferase I
MAWPRRCAAHSMNIEPVTPADRVVWIAMRDALWPDSRDTHAADVERFFSGQAREPLAVLLARDDHQRALGFAELSIRPYAEGCTTDNVAFLEGWFVMPQARGRGVGRALLAASEEWARSQGCSELASDAEADNEASIAAHLALGFSDEGLVRCFSKKL